MRQSVNWEVMRRTTRNVTNVNLSMHRIMRIRTWSGLDVTILSVGNGIIPYAKVSPTRTAPKNWRLTKIISVLKPAERVTLENKSLVRSKKTD